MSYSAADAYASAPSPASPTRPAPVQQPRYSTSSGARAFDAGDYEARAGTASRSSMAKHAGGPAQAWREESESEDEDWNVYDDFNNAAPLSAAGSRSMIAGVTGAGGGAASAGRPSGDGYWGPQGGSRNARNSRGSALLDASAFGFDAQTSDPRVVGDQPMPSSPSYAYGGNYGGYAAAPPDTPGSYAGKETGEGIELITVPALGTEYTDEERRMMKGRERRKSKLAKKKNRIGRSTGKWARGETKLCGWLSPRLAVFLAFGILILLGITLYFVIPRVPTFAFFSAQPLLAVPNAGSMSTTYTPTRSFAMRMNISLAGDNRGGYIPSSATDLDIKVYSLSTRKLVGEGKMDSQTFPGKKRTQFLFPIDFSYTSLNATASGDSTFQEFYQACGHKVPGTARPTLNLAVSLTMKITGLIGRKGASTQLNSIECPFELDSDQ